MAISVTVEDKQTIGPEKVHSGYLNLATYATGGVAFAAKDFKLRTLRQLDVPNIALISGSQRLVTVDETNAKIMAHTAINTEVANGTDLATMKVRWVARGK